MGGPSPGYPFVESKILLYFITLFSVVMLILLVAGMELAKLPGLGSS